MTIGQGLESRRIWSRGMGERMEGIRSTGEEERGSTEFEERGVQRREG